MPSETTSLFWITLAAVIAPLLAMVVPRKLVPEVVLLLVLGIVIGPYGAELADLTHGIELLRELGLAMLFLLAGYELDPKELTGRPGRKAMVTWLVCLGVAFTLVGSLHVTGVIDGEIAVAIALTSTALGTLLPILKDNGLIRTRLGAEVMRHGAYGELGPIVAIALLLGARGTLESLVVLLAFAAVTVMLALPSRRIRRGTSPILHLIRAGAETTGQVPLRMTILLLVTLIAVASAFELDIVLAAFAAGFILRLALPDGYERLEIKLEGIAFGLLVPIFFVTSGMEIDVAAIADHPIAFVATIAAILVCRGGPVFVSTRVGTTATTDGPVGHSLPVALYAATGLPIIVAVTSIAVTAGQMSTDNASLLVGAGAATTLVFPLAATLVLARRTTVTPTDSPAV